MLGRKDMLLPLALVGPVAISIMLCSVAVPDAILQTVSDLAGKTRHGMEWPDTHRFPPG